LQRAGAASYSSSWFAAVTRTGRRARAARTAAGPSRRRRWFFGERDCGAGGTRSLSCVARPVQIWHGAFTASQPVAVKGSRQAGNETLLSTAVDRRQAARLASPQPSRAAAL